MLMITPGGSHDIDNGGQWKPTLTPTTTKLKGVVMPLSNKDLEYLPEGTYTKDSRKLYTNGATVEVGAQFTDTFDQNTYTVTTEMTHGPIHPQKRYMVTLRGRASSK